MDSAVNEEVCQQLEAIADLLEAQNATPFRVGAYRRASSTLRELERPVGDLFEAEGIEGLERLPGVGHSIGSLLREYVRTGRITLLERLQGEVTAEAVLASVPGIGPRLASRIHE
jgi:DNA polymerase/3'-5' exonuclease PolX